MKLWFLKDTQRVAKERAAVEQLASEAGWFSLQRWCLFEWRFCAEGVIRAHEADYPVRLIYPDQFPQVPAWVEPQDSQAKWTNHQYGAGGTLCLELRPDTWEEAATGADVLMSAHRLLDIEKPLSEESVRVQAPSAHRVGAVQSYDWSSDPLFISAGCLERIRTGTVSNLKSGHSAYRDGVFPIFVHDEVDREAAQRPPTVAVGFSEMPVFVSRRAAPISKLDRRDELRSAAELAQDDDAQFTTADCAVVLFAGGAELGAFLALGEGPPLPLKLVVAAESEGLRSGRSAQAANKHVAVVGAGSVGSKLAECLIRSGVRRLTLVDGDVMLPANLERHALDWRDVGYRKVKALRHRLLSIVPGVRVKEIADNLNWQRSARTHAWQVEAIVECDVIVDATGDVPTALFLGAVAAANGRSFVSVEVFEGGSGALVASCVPKRDPPYSKARAAFLSWCEQQGVAAPKATGRPYESLSDEGAPLVADDAAVSIAAGHASRVVLDIVDGKPAAPEAAWMLVGFQKAWLFDGHGQTIRLSIGSPGEVIESPVDKEVLAFVAEVVMEAANEGRSPG